MERGRIAAWSGGAAAIAMATFACRQLVGIGDDPPQGSPATSTDSGAEGGFTYGQGDCARCVTTSCGPQATACAGTPSCAALEGCMSAASGDPTKRAQCGVDHGLGNDVATPAFEACLAGSCAGACGLTCGGLAAVFPPATATGCQACAAGSSECPSVTACATDPECQAAARCQFSTQTLDVWEACPQLSGQDAGVSSTLFSQSPPIASSCTTECSWGADWSCVGKFNWPSANPGRVDVIVNVDDIVSGAPIANATVKLCNTVDPTCVNAFATGTTGEDGSVTLVRPPVVGSVSHYVDISSPTIDPLIEILVFPLREQQVTIPVPALQRGGNAYFASLGGVTLNPDLGELYVTAVDCRLALAPGVQCSLVPQGGAQGPFYFVNNGPSLDAGGTTNAGITAFFNVMPTLTPPTLTVTALGRASTSTPVFVRAGVETIVYAPPTP